MSKKLSISFPVIRAEVVIIKEVYGFKAHSLCPSEPKRLDSGFALYPSGQKPCPLSLHTTFFTAYLLAFLSLITEKKMLPTLSKK
ncbi:MAG: hypothetical protein ACETWK_06915 [Candidatus Aminicenantaceae bacterium]